MIELILLGAGALCLLGRKKQAVAGIGNVARGRRANAAKELYNIASGYENVTYNQIYRSCFYDPKIEAWRYIGKAHDYSYDDM